MSVVVRVLLVDARIGDAAKLRGRLTGALGEEGFTLDHVLTGMAAQVRLRVRPPPHVMLIDTAHPDLDDLRAHVAGDPAIDAVAVMTWGDSDTPGEMARLLSRIAQSGSERPSSLDSWSGRLDKVRSDVDGALADIRLGREVVGGIGGEVTTLRTEMREGFARLEAIIATPGIHVRAVVAAGAWVGARWDAHPWMAVLLLVATGVLSFTAWATAGTVTATISASVADLLRLDWVGR